MNNNLNRFKLKLLLFEQKLKRDKTQEPVTVVKLMTNQLNSLTTNMKKMRKRRTTRLASFNDNYVLFFVLPRDKKQKQKR